MNDEPLASAKKRWTIPMVAGAIIACGVFSFSFSGHIWGLPNWFWEYVAFPAMYVAGLVSFVSFIFVVSLDTKMKRHP